jgi:hypothetical protein
MPNANNRPQRSGARTSGGRGTPGRDRPRRTTPPTTSFKGNSTDLAGQIFDCSDYKQADKYVNTLKRISEHVGSAYKHGGDIRSSIVNETLFTVPIPAQPAAPTDPRALTPAEVLAQMIFKEK